MADEKEVKPENKGTVPSAQVAAPEPAPNDNTPNKPDEEEKKADNRPEEEKNPLLKKILKPDTSHQKHETGLDEMQNLANEIQANTLNSGTVYDAYRQIKGKTKKPEKPEKPEEPEKPNAASESEEKEEYNDDGVTYDPTGTSGHQDLDAEGSSPDDPELPNSDPDDPGPPNSDPDDPGPPNSDPDDPGPPDSDPDDPGPPSSDPDDEEPAVALRAMEDSHSSPADAAGATPASAFPKSPAPTSANTHSDPRPEMEADFESPTPGG